MARIPKRLYGPAQVATGPATVYTVPALTKTLIRHLHVSNPSASPVGLTLSIGADAAGTRLLSAYSVAAAGTGVLGSVQDIFWYQIMDAAEILTLSATINNTLVIVINGDEIVLG
jgi:hypothetical protein